MSSYLHLIIAITIVKKRDDWNVKLLLSLERTNKYWKIQGRLCGWTSSPTWTGPPWHDSIGEDFDLGGLTVAVSNPDRTKNEG